MSKKIEREQGARCARMPGERFATQVAAEEMRMTRQINVVTGGGGQGMYCVKRCACNGYHLLTEENLQKWEANRRATRRERGRNA